MARPNKYNARKTEIGRAKFDSKKEASRYVELKALERAGKIKNLQTQVWYKLIPSQIKSDGTREYPCQYVADFVYEKAGKTIVEDVKGYKGSGAYNLFTIKRKLMLERYGIEVQEV